MLSVSLARPPCQCGKLPHGHGAEGKRADHVSADSENTSGKETCKLPQLPSQKGSVQGEVKNFVHDEARLAVPGESSCETRDKRFN